MKAATVDAYRAGKALMAFRAGENSVNARVGAILLADGLECLRELRGLVRGLSKGARPRGRRG